MPQQKSIEQGWQSLYPFQSHGMDIEGANYHYIDEYTGDSPNPPVLLFVHGNPTWSFHWRNLVLAHRDTFRCIAPDHLGCGLSDAPPQTFRLADRIEHLVELIDSLSLDRITLVAQDWGGAIGLGAALEREEQFDRFVLFNTGAFRPWFIPWRIRICRFPLLGKLGLQGLNLFSRAALSMTITRQKKLSKEVRKAYLAPYNCWSRRRAVYDFVEDIPLNDKHPTWKTLEAIEDRLPTLDPKPVQLIWGMKDWCFNTSCLDKFQSLLPYAAVREIPDAGHWVVEDAAEEIETVLQEFLAKT